MSTNCPQHDNYDATLPITHDDPVNHTAVPQVTPVDTWHPACLWAQTHYERTGATTSRWDYHPEHHTTLENELYRRFNDPELRQPMLNAAHHEEPA